MTKISVANVEEDVWVRFKTHVMEKRRKIKSVLGEELTEAIQGYLERENERKKTQKKEPREKIENVPVPSNLRLPLQRHR